MLRLHRRHAGTRAFTLIELLVVIAIISILAAMLLPAVVAGRRLARERKCWAHMADLHKGCEQYLVSHGDTRWVPFWLTQLADYGYLGNLRDSNQRMPSDPGYDIESIPQGNRKSPLLCPNDGSDSKDGGRPNNLSWDDEGSENPADQYPRADVDAHAPAPFPDSTGDAALEAADTVPCSYLYEFNSELCDWIYDYMTEPTQNEFQGATWDWPTFVRLTDQNGDGKVSWYEVKDICLKGNKSVNLTRYGTSRVPFIRCFWHVKNYHLVANSKVFSVRRDGSVASGTPEWYKD